MLTGSFTYTTDRKGRVVLPVAFRKCLGDPLVLARAPEGCVLALSPATWKRIARKKGDAKYREYWLSGAHLCTIDATTGRVLVPINLRNHLGILPGDSLTVAGLGDAALICRSELFSEHLRRLEAQILESLTIEEPAMRAAA